MYSFFRGLYGGGSTRMAPPSLRSGLSADLAEVQRFLISDWLPGLTAVIAIRFVRLDLTRKFYVVVAGGTITHWLLG